MTDSVLCEQRGTSAWLTLNRPQVHNAFDDGLIAELTHALEQADADPAVRAVVLDHEFPIDGADLAGIGTVFNIVLIGRRRQGERRPILDQRNPTRDDSDDPLGCGYPPWRIPCPKPSRP